jgi:hypothetical protein
LRQLTEGGAGSRRGAAVSHRREGNQSATGRRATSRENGDRELEEEAAKKLIPCLE